MFSGLDKVSPATERHNLFNLKKKKKKKKQILGTHKDQGKVRWTITGQGGSVPLVSWEEGLL